MRAKRIIEGSTFGPEVLEVVKQAFDEAWETISEHCDASEREEIREALAVAVMSAARVDSLDTTAMRDAGIRAMQRAFPDALDGPPDAG